MHDRVRYFLDNLKDAGGAYRILWSTKRDPGDRYDNLYYVVCYGKAGADDRHPLACGVLLNALDGGLEILFSSGNVGYDDDVSHILNVAATWANRNSGNPEPDIVMAALGEAEDKLHVFSFELPSPGARLAAERARDMCREALDSMRNAQCAAGG